MDSEWVKLVLAIFSGLATCIPLVIKLVEYVKRAVKEKNWPDVVKLVIKLMSEVEDKMEDGADKKAYVLAVLKASADAIDYNLNDKDYERIGELIDDMCDMSKVINTPGEKQKKVTNATGEKQKAGE